MSMYARQATRPGDLKNIFLNFFTGFFEKDFAEKCQYYDIISMKKPMSLPLS